MQGFQRIRDELETLGARVVGVSADTFAAQGAFAEKQGIEFPLLSDWPENKTVQAFGVAREGMPLAMRVTFIFDAEGVVRAVVEDERNMEAHPEGALAAVKELVGS
jgi:thioredoxin-dependent peroxiredoxin